eukprot:TRINITY_DN28960_c0_g1_i1.p1 TRINITY_DN28960_c0_g1~~TRINITY_DN28960_c0_g1_i1.p1  ORF type:complete len:655 (+),score=164.82 TRINITY_DN28960_c0_g1_i1:46-1965(+)
MAAAESPVSTSDVQAFIDEANLTYERLHKEFEDQFWGTKMALGGDKFSKERLSSTKNDMEAFLRDADRHATARRYLASGACTKEQAHVLKIFDRTFSCYLMSSDEAVALRNKITKMESDLEQKRNNLTLGYQEPSSDGKRRFVELSSVGLMNKMRTSDCEATRKACYEGLMSIGPFVLGSGFAAIVRDRNRLARLLGYEDFYDYKVTQAEGFGKRRLFEVLDQLLERTRALQQRARDQLAAEKGKAALEPWNTGYMLAGDLTKKQDAFFPFENAVEMWGRSFAAMGIRYRGATMSLDLLDRKGKYSNGFCHWPQPAWRRPDGTFQASSTNFTSLADPAAVGSGQTALKTLMHEAGHAAHFANIEQPSPLFSQERAPTSVAYAENQSMFLDSLCRDAAWIGRYCRSRIGEPMPWELVEEGIRSKGPYEVFELARMLVVPFFERALYELPDEEITDDRILALAKEVETRVQGGAAPRPLLSVPHILSDESSCYYHGYVLAEMSVYQTREYFFRTHGSIVDNPKVGEVLTANYWICGNSEMFFDLVERLTGRPLTGDAWVVALEQDIDARVREERVAYDRAVALPDPRGGGEVELDMRMRLVDGDLVISETCPGVTSFVQACEKFKEYVAQRAKAGKGNAGA